MRALRQGAESIKVIGLKENMWAARIFISETGYLMEIDSIPRKYSEYDKSFFGYYDVTTKGLNWKISFDIDDIKFKGNLPMKINVN